MDALALIPGGDAALFHAILVFVRVAAIVGLAPAFGEQFIPLRIRLSLALGFAAVVLPAVPQSSDRDFGPIEILSEALIGLAFGLLLRLAVFAIRIAGSIAAQSVSLTHLAAGADAEPLPSFGQVVLLGALTLAVISGLPEAFAAFLIQSYDAVPIATHGAFSAIGQIALHDAGAVLARAFSFALPFLVIGLVYNVGLGAINRAMPTLMVSLVGAPAISLAALGLLSVLAPVMVDLWRDLLFALLASGRFPT